MKARIKEEILTIPNILSMMRIAMIAAVVVLFVMKYYLAAGIVLICSGVTDILDGFIARTFNMISALGKALDPFADKLTQFAVLICLSLLNPLILIPFVILVFRDAFMLLTGLSIFKKTKSTFSARWYGKIATMYTYCLMCALLVFKDYMEKNLTLTVILIIVDAVLIAFSFVMYAIRNTRELHNLPEEEKNENISNKSKEGIVDKLK